MTHQMNRRAMLKGSATALVAAPVSMAAGSSGASAKVVSGQDGFAYEVTRTDAEWRAILDADTYAVLRQGATEEPKTNPNWNEARAGSYACRGCDLPLYESAWKVEVDKGWAFFRHSVPNAVLTDIDWPQEAGMNPDYGRMTVVEVHCRRCGSHLGHIVRIDAQVLHCINGTSLSFAPRAV